MFPRFPFFPRLPSLGPLVKEDEEETPQKVAPQKELTSEEAFREEMAAQGVSPELIEMGVKVAKNHLKTPKEAYEIGRNYIKEMSK